MRNTIWHGFVSFLILLTMLEREKLEEIQNRTCTVPGEKLLQDHLSLIGLRLTFSSVPMAMRPFSCKNGEIPLLCDLT